MTPLWRRAVKRALKLNRHPVKSARGLADKLLRAHHCFDLTAVAELLRRTASEIADATNEVEPGVWDVDLGERAVLPASNMWVEHQVADRESCLLVEPGNEEGSYFLWRWTPHEYIAAQWLSWDDATQADFINRMLAERDSFARPPQPEDMLNHDQLMPVAALRDVGDGIFWLSTRAKGEDADGHFGIDPARVQRGIKSFAMTDVSTLLAAIAIIASPRAERQAVVPHKGLAAQIRGVAQGMPTAKATRIVLGGMGTSVAGSPRLDTSPRAYHFCRAYTRTRASGRVERVRAHWRGDPAFGIRIGSYDVRGPKSPPSDDGVDP